MKIFIYWIYTAAFCLAFSCVCTAQIKCASGPYIEVLKQQTPALAHRFLEVQHFISLAAAGGAQSIESKQSESSTLHIPVVIHVLYSSGEESISDEQIHSQISALNRDYQRKNPDTTNTPERFRSLAADVQIDFQLATADPTGHPTNGIIRKQTKEKWWQTNDEMKFSVHGGDDGWDSRNYLNIWVCRLQGFLGYSSNPGCPSEIDGVVISSSVFGTINTEAPYHMGRTAVHEIGHWLGLKHIWGDSFCGDDLVDDTPRQGSFTKGCPGGKFLSSCDNGPLGDMYMNYMDFTDDACMNLFTNGQKQRMLAHFAPGGPRNTIRFSKGLEKPWVFTSIGQTQPIENPSLSLVLYPNPVTTALHLSCDNNLIGNEVRIIGLNGNLMLRLKILSSTQKIDMERLTPGLYFVEIRKGSQHLRQRFVKL